MAAAARICNSHANRLWKVRLQNAHTAAYLPPHASRTGRPPLPGPPCLHFCHCRVPVDELLHLSRVHIFSTTDDLGRAQRVREQQQP